MFKSRTTVCAVDTQTITAAAMETLDDAGLDKLTMRSVAARLGVQVGGLYYHLPDKSALLRSMADSVCRQALADFEGRHRPADAWPDAVAELCRCTRRTLRARRDSARVLAAAPRSGSTGAFALMDRLIALLEAGVVPERADVAADTLMSYVTGFVLQEQVEASAPAAPELPLEELAARFPRVFRDHDVDDDAIFEESVAAIVDGFAVQPRGRGRQGAVKPS